MQLENVQSWPKITKIDPKMTKIDPKTLKIRQIDPKISKKCVNYCKIPTQDKTVRLPLKILLMVPKLTGRLLPSFPHNLHLWTSSDGTNILLAKFFPIVW